MVNLFTICEKVLSIISYKVNQMRILYFLQILNGLQRLQVASDIDNALAWLYKVIKYYCMKFKLLIIFVLTYRLLCKSVCSSTKRIHGGPARKVDRNILHLLPSNVNGKCKMLQLCCKYLHNYAPGCLADLLRNMFSNSSFLSQERIFLLFDPSVWLALGYEIILKEMLSSDQPFLRFSKFLNTLRRKSLAFGYCEQRIAFLRLFLIYYLLSFP